MGGAVEVDLLQGTLDMLILKALTWGPNHGFGVARWIRETTRDALTIEEGSLYPALHRLTRRGWVSAQWGISDNNRRARYYRLTPTGRAQLTQELKAWRRFNEVVALVVAAEPARGAGG
jgi:PadR family transcriptional regulator PadR